MEKVRQEVQTIITEQIRPQLATHGGDLELLGIQNNIVSVRLLGACSTCPSNQDTVSHVIEDAIQQEHPELSVQVEFGVSDELIEQALKILRKANN